MADVKAGFVDGRNFVNMVRVLGYRRPEFGALYKFLLEQVGDSRVFFARPLYTLPEGAISLMRPLEKNGFKPFPVPAEQGRDDDLIIREITHLDHEKISEIVLVAADGGYVDVLRAKAAQGIRVYMVATKEVDRESGTPMLPRELLEGKFPEINLVELADFKEQIMQGPLSEEEKRGRAFKKREVTDTRKGSRQITVSFEVPADPQKVLAVTMTLGNLIAHHPEIGISIQAPPTK